MKLLTALLMTMLAAPAFAQSTETSIEVTADQPIECNERAPDINFVSNVKKIAESDDQVSFSLDTSYGSCASGGFVPTALSDVSTVELMRNKIVLFQKQPMASTFTAVSATQGHVVLTFDKSRVFKNSDSAMFLMSFLPMGHPVALQTNANGQVSFYQPPSYPWTVVITENETGGCSLNVRVGAN